MGDSRWVYNFDRIVAIGDSFFEVFEMTPNFDIMDVFSLADIIYLSLSQFFVVFYLRAATTPCWLINLVEL